MKDNKKYLVLLFVITYFVSYITRINYGAIVAEMVRATGMSKSMLSMALTGSFITYGTGQIVSGICGDKFSPKRLISYGLMATVIMNLLIPLCNNPYQMLVVWCVNGLAQSFMWPPLVKLMTTFFTEDEYNRATVKVSWGSSCGTIAIYLIAPALISLWGWKAVFIFSAACGGMMLLVWNRYCVEPSTMSKVSKKDVPDTDAEKIQQPRANNLGILVTLPMIGVMFVIIFQGMLRDGITTWMPSYILETYKVSSVISILTGVILPIFSIISFQITSKLYQKKFKNPLSCGAVLFAVGSFAALVLVLSTGKNAMVSVLFSALLTGCMHGINLLLICMLPAFFKKYGNVSTISGVLNSCTYIGSAISTYGIAVLAEQFSWNVTIIVWMGVAVAGAVICFFCARPWNRMFNE